MGNATELSKWCTTLPLGDFRWYTRASFQVPHYDVTYQYPSQPELLSLAQPNMKSEGSRKVIV